MAEEVLMTQEGYDKNVQELDYLISVRRPEVAQHLAEARSYGDLSENAEYDAAKNEQAELEEKIQKLENMIHNAKIVSEEEIDALRHAGRCGVVLLATAHAADCRELRQRNQMDALRGLFPYLVLVNRNTIRMERWEC